MPDLTRAEQLASIPPAALAIYAAELEDALRPFANYACDEPCNCHNCRARALLAKYGRTAP
jgi:hypothetical protein